MNDDDASTIVETPTGTKQSDTDDSDLIVAQEKQLEQQQQPKVVNLSAPEATDGNESNAASVIDDESIDNGGGIIDNCDNQSSQMILSEENVSSVPLPQKTNDAKSTGSVDVVTSPANQSINLNANSPISNVDTPVATQQSQAESQKGYMYCIKEY